MACFYSTRFFATTLNWTLSMHEEKKTEMNHQAGSSGCLLEKGTVTPGEDSSVGLTANMLQRVKA